MSRRAARLTVDIRMSSFLLGEVAWCSVFRWHLVRGRCGTRLRRVGCAGRAGGTKRVPGIPDDALAPPSVHPEVPFNGTAIEQPPADSLADEHAGECADRGCLRQRRGESLVDHVIAVQTQFRRDVEPEASSPFSDSARARTWRRRPRCLSRGPSAAASARRSRGVSSPACRSRSTWLRDPTIRARGRRLLSTPRR